MVIDENYEGEMSVIVIEDEEGKESYYLEDMVIPHGGQNFAILVSVPSEDGGEEEEASAIIARMEEVDGEMQYVAPTEEEFEAVLKLYQEVEEQD